MRILVACEFSQRVAKSFRDKGHEAYSCDILDGEINSEYHIKDDVRQVLYTEKWDLMIAHPPCTYICNSGVRWLHERPGRAINMSNAASFFKALLDAPIEKICVENPIPHKYALEIIGRKYDQIVQPWQFGHGETKATCLWLKNLPELKPTNIVEGRDQRLHKLPPSKDRGKIRSITYQGIADAMAQQWGA